MKVLVAVKQVVDSAIRVRVKADGSGVDLAGLKMSLNPLDEIAVEEAVRLREKGVASSVVAVTCGPAGWKDALRTAMAMGADRAVLVLTDEETQPLAVAGALRVIAEREKASLVLLGKQSIDTEFNQVGQMLSALAGTPQATNASHVSVVDGGLEVTREVDGGQDVVRLSLPAVVTADLRLNEPRYVTLPNMMKAKKKEIQVLTPAELGVDMAPRLRTLKVVEPTRRSQGVRVPDAASLVDKLRDEAKVI